MRSRKCSRSDLGRRARLLFAIVLTGLLCETSAFATATQHIPVREIVLSRIQRTFVIPGSQPKLAWPRSGQAAVAVRGVGVFASSPNERSVPIASLTKMMTALVILRDHPLTLRQPGPSLTISPGDVSDYKSEEAAGDSVMRVVAGERLSEYQLLEALLIPSGDNIADLLAVWDSGSIAGFVAKMNALGNAMGLASTHYADASGVSPASVSTASEQAKVAAIVMGSPVIRSIVRRPQLPFVDAGTIKNFNPALGEAGIIGVKSGWTSEAKSCLATAAFREVDHRSVLIVSVTLGQPGSLAVPAREDESLLRLVTSSLSAYRIVDPGMSVSIPGRGATQAMLDRHAPRVIIGWHGLRLTERVILNKGESPSVLADQAAGAAVGRLEVADPWRKIETIGLKSGAPSLPV